MCRPSSLAPSRALPTDVLNQGMVVLLCRLVHTVGGFDGCRKYWGRIFGSKNTRSRSCRVFWEAAHALVDVPAAGILVVNQPRVLGHGSKILRAENTPEPLPNLFHLDHPTQGYAQAREINDKGYSSRNPRTPLLSNPRTKDGKSLGQGTRSMGRQKGRHPVSLPRSPSSRRHHGYPRRNTPTPRTLNPTVSVFSIDSMGFLSSRPNQGGGGDMAVV